MMINGYGYVYEMNRLLSKYVWKVRPNFGFQFSYLSCELSILSSREIQNYLLNAFMSLDLFILFSRSDCSFVIPLVE
jgi:hypothetical protein